LKKPSAIPTLRDVSRLRRTAPVRATIRRFPSVAAWLHARWIQHRALVPVDVLTDQYESILRTSFRPDPRFATGDYLEFGVYRGDSLLCMQRASERTGHTGMRLFGFDSFEGMPSTDTPEDQAMRAGGSLTFQPGALRSGLDATVKAMTGAGADWTRITLVPGWFDDSLTPALREERDLRRAAVIMLDCVLYSSTYAALCFCEPIMRKETIVVLDDWDAGSELGPNAAGERRAFEDFIAAHPTLSAEPIGSYRHEEDDSPSAAMVMRVTRAGSPD
jgi:hypothetical protein